MEKYESLPCNTHDYLPTESASNRLCNDSSRVFTLSWSSAGTSKIYNKRLYRTMSLANFSSELYTPGEIRRIRERLLRTNTHLEPSAIKNFSSSQKKTLASIALMDFMGFCSMSIMAPFFPREAAEKGLSDTLSGFVFSFYALVMFLTSPIFGKLLPKIGAKTLFLCGMLTAGTCNLLFGMLEFVQNYTFFTILCLFLRGFEALGASAYSTASYVFVVNNFPDNIGSVLGILETFVGLGMSTGPAIGGFLYSLGGFEMPFFVLGTAMILIVPINSYLLPSVNEYNFETKSTSMIKLIKIPSITVTSMVIVGVASVWGFLDPTLEPHLRQFNLTTEKVGLIFLLFSALYGISSPIWGSLADKINNHWSMMTLGLLSCTGGLLLLGPCPYLPFLKNSLWLDLVALSILGVSVALALLPTFKSFLRSAMNNGCGDSIATYSMVAGVWSCMYSLGEVIGPSLGGFLLQHYGFPMTATIMATITFSLATITCVYFIIKSYNCNDCENVSDSGICASWKSSIEDGDIFEKRSLLSPSMTETTLRHYTEEKIHCYEESRRRDNENGETDYNQVTDIRGTVAITGKGSCEV